MNTAANTTRPTYEMVSTHELKEGDLVLNHGGLFRLKERKEHPANPKACSYSRDLEIEQRNGVCVTFRTDLMNDGGDIPRSWLADGWTIQGNGAARWARVTA